jgi:hypothetical protein
VLGRTTPAIHINGSPSLPGGDGGEDDNCGSGGAGGGGYGGGGGAGVADNTAGGSGGSWAMQSTIDGGPTACSSNTSVGVVKLVFDL